MRHAHVSKPLVLMLSLAFIFANAGEGAASSSRPSDTDLASGAAPARLQEAGPIVQFSTRNDTSLPLRSVMPIPPRGLPEGTEIPRLDLPRHGLTIPFLTPDPVLQPAIGGGVMPDPIRSFAGVGNVNKVLPPDPNGDIGPEHYVQIVNLSFAIWDREGNLLYGPADNNTLFEGFGGPCEETNNGDPIVLYDHLADRWLMSQFALPVGFNGPFFQCLAVSQTPDPTGAWHRYEFKTSDTKLNDYAKFGVWPDAYYMAINQFTAPDLSWGGQGVASFEREAMLDGRPARMVSFDLFFRDVNLGGMLPSDLDGAEPPPGTPNFFVQLDDDVWGYSPDQLQVWEFRVDWADPEASTFNRLGALATAAFDSNMCNSSRNCVPQPGGSGLDAIADRLMYRLQYRNFGDYQTLVTNHTVDVDGADHAGIRWYELRDSGEGWRIHQQGTFAPDSNHRWMGSLAMDRFGNMALGYSLSSKTIFPSVRYTGRKADDPLGSMPQGEGSIVEGSGSQTNSSGRWGDYSMMAVDPTDGCTFWYTSEYYAADSALDWMTRIGAFRFPECSAGPAPTPTQTQPGPTSTPTATNTPTNTPAPGNPPDIEVSPDRFEVTLAQGETANEELTLRNVGGSALTFEVSLKDTTGGSSAAEAWQPASFPPAKVEPGLREALLQTPDGRGKFLIYLVAQADLGEAYSIQGWEERGRFVYERLWNTAEDTQGGLVLALEQMKAAGSVSEFRRFYIVNAVSVTGTAEALDKVAARPDVAYIEAVKEYQIPEPIPGEEAGISAVEWGVAKIGADRVWSDLNVGGAGVVVANIDTGVMFDHKALVKKYRGTGTGTHDYNWFDPQGGKVPSDSVGHGTHTMGTMVGDDGAGNQVGIAPAAQWIAAKGCASFSCSEVDLLASAEWMLAPYPIGGTSKQGDPAKRPHIVNNSWGGAGGDTFYLEAVKAWRAANILPVFSAGNSGPYSGSIGSPADYAESFGVGATDSGDTIAYFSSRGPSRMTNETKPDVSAPGVDVRSAYNDGEYATYSGTSMAGPHVAGCAALVLSASPGMDIANLEKVLTAHVVDLGQKGPDNDYGYGRIDCYGAVSEAKSFWLRVSPTSGSVEAGGQQKLSVTIDARGLAVGNHTANIVLDTNDPDEDPVVVPVTLHVTQTGATPTSSPTFTPSSTPTPTQPGPTATPTNTPPPGNPPDIEITPDRFEVTLVQGETADKELTIRNVGGSMLTFEVSVKDTTGGSSASEAWQPESFPTAKVEPGLREALLQTSGGQGKFLVYLTAQANLGQAFSMQNWEDRGQFVYESLWKTAQDSQGGLVSALEQMMQAGTVSEFRRFYIVNAISVTGTQEALNILAARPDVAYIEAAKVYHIPEPIPGELPGITAVEWGVAKIGADRIWSEYGVRGAGVVVANIDTGVMFNHKALVNQYRGTATSNHNYNWFDPQGGAVPSDSVGHGTHTMGTMVGDDGAGNQVGIAPAAQWIAAKGCASNYCSVEDLLASAEWVLAPYPIGGTPKQGDPAKRPHIVNNSWGGAGGDRFYLESVKAWRAANILPVFSAGNSGPSAGSIGSPADYAESFAVGATDSGDTIAYFSSRGPSTLTDETKPDVSAPGVNVRSAYYDGGYATYSGTSMAGPHVAGCAALVLSASPGMDIGSLEKLLTAHVVDLGEKGPDNTYGYGRIDCYGAVSDAKSFWLRVSPTSGSVAAGGQQRLTVTLDARGLEVRTYKGEIVLGTNDPDENSVIVPVTLTVNKTGATPTSTPTAGITRTPSATPTSSPTAGLTRTPSSTPISSPTAGLTRTPSVTPTVAPPTRTPSPTFWPTFVPSPTTPPEDKTLHVGDLDGIGVVADAGGWKAQVTITIHDGNEASLPGTQLTGLWVGGAWSIGSCTTGILGQCSLVSGRIPNWFGFEYFLVLSASHPTYAYDQQANHDPDGDSDGTLIIVSRP